MTACEHLFSLAALHTCATHGGCGVAIRYVLPVLWMTSSFSRELDKITIIKELLRVKFGFMSLPLFDAEQLDCMSSK